LAKTFFEFNLKHYVKVSSIKMRISYLFIFKTIKFYITENYKIHCITLAGAVAWATAPNDMTGASGRFSRFWKVKKLQICLIRKRCNHKKWTFNAWLRSATSSNVKLAIWSTIWLIFSENCLDWPSAGGRSIGSAWFFKGASGFERK